MYTLYYMPGACSMAVHVVLNELGQKVTLVNANTPEGNRTAEFLKVNPRGSVPALVEDGTTIREGGAIISYLVDKHNGSLLPKAGKERANGLEWLMFANATMHPAYARVFWLLKNAPDGEVKTQLVTAAIDQINKLWADVDGQLAKTPYICGKECSAADILLTVIANWGQTFPKKIELGANVKRMLKNVIARPAYQEALVSEKVEYKAAA